MKKTTTLILTVFLLWGCASVYKPIQPSSLNYSNTEVGEEISYSYKFDVLNEKGNKRYARKEDKFNIDILSVKLINNTNKELDFNKNVKCYMGDRELYPLESNSVTSRIKQGVIGYILYGFVFLYIGNEENVTTIPIGLPIGIGNMIAAGSSNGKFKREFSEYNLVNKTINPGDTIYGLVAFKDIEYGKFEMKIVE
jgi:hypothetical protein